MRFKFSVLLLLLTLPVLATGALYQVKSERIQRQRPKVTIDVRFPLLAGLPAPVTKVFNQRSRNEAQKTVADFDKEVRQTLKENPQLSGYEMSLHSDFTVKHRSHKLLVLLFSGDEYQGGAHPAPFIYSQFIDPKTGRRLALKELFRPGQTYLQVLSSESAARLKDTPDSLSDPEWLARGTAPKDDNFTAVYPGEDGLHVIFPAYQVAPYAAGTPEITIPYAKFSGMLSDRYFDN